MFKNLLVTGGAGFIGSNFIRYLFGQAGYEGRVINYDSLTYAGNPASLDDVKERFKDRYFFLRGDICDRNLLSATLERFGIDAICHFAAESHVDRSIASPGDFARTNVMGTFTLLEEARRLGKGLVRFHHISTDEVFGSLGKDGYFSETTPYDPHSPYSASKAASDHFVRAYGDTYGIPVSISNCSNNYGPYQFPEKLVPLMILNALEGKDLPVYGDGLNVRDWLHVEDHCAAVWLIMTKGAAGSDYCIGGRSELENIEVVRRIANLVDRHAPPLSSGKRRESLIRHVADRLGHDRRYAIDCSKIERELGFRQSKNADDGFEETVLWYLNNPGWVESVRSGQYLRWIELNYGSR